MKRWFSCVVLGTGLLLALAQLSSAAFVSRVNKLGCTFRGKRLYGRVQIVESLPDMRVQIVSNIQELPDLRVRPVNAFPNQCGEWQFVESMSDFRIQIVTNFANPDLRIQLVENSPGIPDPSRFYGNP